MIELLSKKTIKHNIIILLYFFFATACSSPPVAKSPVQERVQAADKEARRALKHGELARAHYHFSQALTLQQSLDDVEGAGTTLINLATVAHRARDSERALAYLDKILRDPVKRYGLDTQRNALFRQAVILTDLGRVQAAEEGLQRVQMLCDKDCTLHWNITNLRARLALQTGDTTGALALAQRVAKEAAAGAEEQANAWRVAAAAEARLQRYADAQNSYNAALALDKTSGASARIADDLAGLAQVTAALGQTEAAAAYAARAQQVRDALREKQ